MIRALQHQRLRELVAAAFAGAAWRDANTMDVQLEGVPLAVSVSSGRHGSSVRVTFPLAPAPIVPRLHLNAQNVFTPGGPPRVVLGDPAFDARYKLLGAPKELVLRALSPPTRAALLACPKGTAATADEGQLELRCAHGELDVDGVRALAYAGARLGAGLSRAYRDELAERARVGGQPWAEAAHAAMQAQVDAGRRATALGRGITLVFVLVVLLCIAVVFGMVFVTALPSR